MKTRCPCCGVTASLEVLITHDEARSLMVALAGISDELAKAALRYLGLFRPGERDLSWARAAKLLGELVPLIQAGEITRKRQSYPAPREAWIWAFIRQAFGALWATVDRWPTPKMLIACIPPVPPPPQLEAPKKVWTEEEIARNKKRLAEMLGMLADKMIERNQFLDDGRNEDEPN